MKIAYLPQFWPEEVAEGTVGDFFDWVKETANPLSTKGSSAHPEGNPKLLFTKIARDVSFGGGGMGEGWPKKPIAKFSGGEQRILWFLAALSLPDIDILMLDEPTNHMDRSLQAKVAQAIQKFPGTIILSTHDKDLITTLTKEGGATRGRVRKPTHLILSKSAGVTKIERSKEDPVTYMQKLMEDAKKEARKFRI